VGRVIIRVDADFLIGGGHAMRCLTLANALAEAGAEVTFVSAAMPDALARRIAEAGFALERISPSPEMQREASKWEEPPLSAEAQLADAEATGAAAGQADWVVVDHYLLDVRWHLSARGFADRILVIDDLANRTCDCDLLLDQTFGRSTDDYRDRVPGGARILAGATYALLRPEFTGERAAALDRRAAGGPVRRIFVSMGTGDPAGITARIVEQALAVARDCAIDVVIGAQATSADLVRELAARHADVSIHANSERMAELMRDADIAVGGAGTTSWERCCLALPTITLVLAENQRLAADNLQRAGAVALADSADQVGALLGRLMDDEGSRLSMIAAAAAITDGNGAKRVSGAMTELAPASDDEPTLRSAKPDDSRTVWLWRNDPVTRAFSQAAAAVPWPDHAAWWQRTLGSTDRQLLIAEVAGEPVAAVRFDRVGDGGFEVSINLAPSARKSGFGGRILGEACRTFRAQHGSVRLVATIHRDNPASCRIFEKLGFVRSGALSNPAFERYVFAEESIQ
jgi:UDP-2,4-diacetamido-2,4,6-trideoxy-beta-L-altropyranose hydrolase